MEHAIVSVSQAWVRLKYKRVPTDVDTRPLPCGSFVPSFVSLDFSIRQWNSNRIGRIVPWHYVLTINRDRRRRRVLCYPWQWAGPSWVASMVQGVRDRRKKHWYFGMFVVVVALGVCCACKIQPPINTQNHQMKKYIYVNKYCVTRYCILFCSHSCLLTMILYFHGIPNPHEWSLCLVRDVFKR